LLANKTMASLAKVRSPSLRESAISMGVLAVLGVVLAGVWRQQARFDPAVTIAATAATAASQGLGAATVPDIVAQWPTG
jgi:ABC-type phosphate transport system auxiliary subunit